MLVKPGSRVRLKDHDPADTGDYKSAEEVVEPLKKLQEELDRLQFLLYADASRALTHCPARHGHIGQGRHHPACHVSVSPLGVQVTAFKAPSDREKAHDFLWRVHQAVPPRGTIGIFNRSHYEDVLVARVHELVPRKVWKARYEQINQFEKMLVKNGVRVLKFFLHISKEEQKKRLEDRLHDPTRYWKLSLADVKERRYWSAYRQAYEEALTRCSTKWAPWHIVPADHKWYRNLVVAEVVVRTLQKMDLKFPQATIDLSKVVID